MIFLLEDRAYANRSDIWAYNLRTTGTDDSSVWFPGASWSCSK